MVDKIFTAYKFDKTNILTEMDSHAINLWSIRWCIKGEVAVFLKNKRFVLKRGQILILPPNTSLSVKIENVNEVQYAVTTFKSNEVLDETLLLTPISLLGREQELLFEYFYTATQIYGDKRVENKLVENYVYSILKTFLLRISITNSKEQNYVLREKIKTTTHVSDQKITLDIKKYLETRLHTFITIDELSKNIGVSKNALMKIFKADTGQTIIEYFTNRKMLLAEKLIIEGELSFRSISEKLGFQTPEYFSRAFKKHTGFTPTEFSLNCSKWQGCVADFC